MTELQSILRAINAPSVLATVVNVEGSAYRQPGARMLVLHDGRSIGTISGGCLEADIIDRAWELTAAGQPALIRYDSRSEDSSDPDGDELLADWGFGLGCNGAVDVLLERIDPASPPHYLASLADALAQRQTIVMATVFARNGDVPVEVGYRLLLDSHTRPRMPLPLFDAARQTFGQGRSQVMTINFPHGSTSPDSAPPDSTLPDSTLPDSTLPDSTLPDSTPGSAKESTAGSARVFCELVTPPPHLLVLGAGHDALPLVRLAAETGWMVSICDRRAAMASSDRFPRADAVHAVPAEESLSILSHPPDGAVVMTHRYPEDIKLLRLLAASPVRYIGVLGPRHRTERLLRAAHIERTVDLDNRLHAPIGLDLGAETPEEIALAILAEATAVLHGYAGGKLRDKNGPIHEPLARETRNPKSEMRSLKNPKL